MMTMIIMMMTMTWSARLHKKEGPQLGHLCSDGCRGKYAAVSDKVSSVRLEASSLSELCLVVCSSQHKWNWPNAKQFADVKYQMGRSANSWPNLSFEGIRTWFFFGQKLKLVWEIINQKGTMSQLIFVTDAASNGPSGPIFGRKWSEMAIHRQKQAFVVTSLKGKHQSCSPKI